MIYIISNKDFDIFWSNLMVSILNFINLRGIVVQWVLRLTRNVEFVGSRPIKDPRLLYPYCLVLVGSRN